MANAMVLDGTANASYHARVVGLNELKFFDASLIKTMLWTPFQVEKCRGCCGSWHHWFTFQECTLASSRSLFKGN